MGFYGKINSNAKSSFTFDKIYPTRKMADIYAGDDGVFIGRFILVDYDHGDYNEYSTIPTEGDSSAIILEVEGSIKRVVDDETGTITYKIYKNGSWQNFDISYASLFNADTAQEPLGYGTQRGYDSTVWQKVASPITGAALYAMTAELNSVVPTFILTPEAPSDNGEPPYFGELTNDVYYDLHLRTPWGFRLKNIENGNPYYNKKGFDLTTVHYSEDDGEDILDSISVTNTGMSGASYYDPITKTSQQLIDTKELTISLPTVGDSIAKVWDVMYGGKELAKINSKGEYKRNTKVQWDGSYSGLRLLNYDNTKNGYTYSTQNVSTLAGAINSTHDLMGKIIRVYHNENLADLSDMRIYYVPFPEEDAPEITPAAGTENCQPGHYYYRYTHYEPDVRQGSSDYPLLDKDSPVSALDDVYVETEEDISEYIASGELSGDLWYQDNETDFMLETNGIEASKEYVTINDNYFAEHTINVGPRYKPNTYYYEEVDNVNGNLYHLDASEEQNPARNYYNLVSTSGQRTSYFYISGQYFYRDKTYTYDGDYQPKANKNFYSLVTGTTNYIAVEDLYKEGFVSSGGKSPMPILCRDLNADPDRYEYYIPTVSAILPSGGGTGQDTQGVTSLTRVDYNGIENNIVNFRSGYFYKPISDGYQIMLVNPANNDFRTPAIYYEIIPEKIDYFYEANKYYYRDDERNYILNTHDELNEDETDYDPNYPLLGDYVLFDPTNPNHVTNVQKIFPDDTFYDENHNLIDAPSDEIDTYYELKEWYVYADANNVYTPGMKWTLPYIPDGVQLSRRKKVYSLVELKGFARDYNTMHGLILKLHDMMGDGADHENFEYRNGVPYLERDKDNIRGAIHTLEDKWNTKFGELVPNSLVVIDSYGRLAGGSAGGDSWISISAGANGVNLAHIGPATTTHTAVSDVTPNFGETFTITDWDFDNKGHKANSGTHTVTIPSGSLSTAQNVSGDVITDLSFTPSSGALVINGRSNVGDLLLTGYTAQSGIGSSSVNANQTLNQALAALDNRIDSSASSGATALSDAINALDTTITAQTGYALTEVTEADGVISKTGEMQIAGIYAPLITPTLSGPYLQSYTNPTTSEVTVPMAADVVYRSGTTPVSTKQIANLDYVDNQIGTAIGSLDATVNASAGHAITGITEVDGIITSISEAELVDYSTDITSLGGRISTLEALNLATRIQALEDAIAALSGGNEEPTPDPEPEPDPEPDPENSGE